MSLPFAQSLGLRYPSLSPTVQTILQVVLGSLFIALFAQVSIPIPLSPVPITGQTFAVLALAMALGSRNAVLAVLAYIAEGASGAPVFAGGVGGPLHIVGPTAGYLFGFILCAAICGKLAELGFDRTYPKMLVAMTLGNLAIFIPGVFWLTRFVPAEQALALGFVPFIPGAILKTLAAAAVFPPLRKRI
ncbi:MAG: biotin transporter BioY [bacterium]|nr:biotin transporter BioY [bacterium]